MEASVLLCDCLDNIIGCAVHIVKSRFIPDHSALLDDAVLDCFFGFVSALSAPIVATFLFVQHVRQHVCSQVPFDRHVPCSTWHSVIFVMSFDAFRSSLRILLSDDTTITRNTFVIFRSARSIPSDILISSPLFVFSPSMDLLLRKFHVLVGVHCLYSMLLGVFSTSDSITKT